MRGQLICIRIERTAWRLAGSSASLCRYREISRGPEQAFGVRAKKQAKEKKVNHPN